MHSFISSSKANRADKPAFVLLLGILALSLLGVEIAARVIYRHFDRGHRQVTSELGQARASSAGAGSPHVVLVAGNSLLEAGIQFDSVREMLLPRWEARRVVVPDTGYLDWFYGLRRLLGDGARPAVIVLCLAPRQLLMSSVRGEYFARYLMNATDIRMVAHDIDAHPTIIGGMVFAHFSEFYAIRTELRKSVLKRLLPDLPQLTSLMLTDTPKPLEGNALARVAETRLRALKDLAAKYRAEFIFVVPPTPLDQGYPGSGTIRDAGQRAGVPVLSLSFDELSPDNYSDGFHLNEKGAKRFTDRLVPMLLDVLRSRSGIPVHDRAAWLRVNDLPLA